MKRLAKTIKKEGAIACLQINPAGRFASGAQPLGPSVVETFGRLPKELTQAELSRVTGRFAERIIRIGSADLIGLARVLWADPDRLRKLSAGRESEILHCDPDGGDAGIQMVMKKKPAFCTRWAPQKVKEYKARFE